MAHPIVFVIPMSAILLILSDIAASAIISTPTSNATNLSIFDASAYDGDFSGNTIDCGDVENCHVFCHETRACEDASINASMVTNLVVECMGDRSCLWTYFLWPGPSTLFNLTCNGTRACRYASVCVYMCYGGQLSYRQSISNHCDPQPDCTYSDLFRLTLRAPVKSMSVAAAQSLQNAMIIRADRLGSTSPLLTRCPSTAISDVIQTRL